MAEQNRRIQALQALREQLPVADSRIAAGQQAARDIQLQQAVASTPKGTPIERTATQLGAVAGQQAGAQAVAGAEQMGTQAARIGTLQLGEQEQASRGRIAAAQLATGEMGLSRDQRLAKISESAKRELLDQQLRFQRDEAGRTLFNERQLADYLRANAASDEEYRSYAQQAENLGKKKLQAMEHAYQILSEDLEQQATVARQQKNFELEKQLAAEKQAAAAQLERERNRSANRKAKWQAGGAVAGTAVGTVVGTYFGNPVAGAAVGSQLGSAAGGMAADTAESREEK